MVIFNTNINFDKSNILKSIDAIIQSKKVGYICVVDANVITLVNKNTNYKNIINTSTLNICDGSSIALFASLFSRKKLTTFTGPEIFKYYIEKPYVHVLVGNTIMIADQIKSKIINNQNYIDNIIHIPLPFTSHENFDYEKISIQIKSFNPDFIWVSLGAPKQEYFIYKLSKYLDSGILFGIGAAFNFYLDYFTISKTNVFGLNFTWFFRLFHEPSKQIKRVSNYIYLLPKLLISQFLYQRRKSKL